MLLVDNQILPYTSESDNLTRQHDNITILLISLIQTRRKEVSGATQREQTVEVVLNEKYVAVVKLAIGTRFRIADSDADLTIHQRPTRRKLTSKSKFWHSYAH